MFGEQQHPASKNTNNERALWVRYGVSFVMIFEKTDHITTAPHYALPTGMNGSHSKKVNALSVRNYTAASLSQPPEPEIMRKQFSAWVPQSWQVDDEFLSILFFLEDSIPFYIQGTSNWYQVQMFYWTCCPWGNVIEGLIIEPYSQ